MVPAITLSGGIRVGLTATLVALIVLASGPLAPARAGDINVDAIADEDNNPGAGCSLREAIIATNNDADYGGCTLAAGSYGADLLNVPSMTYVLTIGGSGEDSAAEGDLDIRDDLQIEGTGAATTFVNGNAIDRVFHIVSGGLSVSLRNMTITGGSSDFGGGIINGGTLTVVDCVVSGNTSVGSFGTGGGIYNFGTLEVTGSDITGNTGGFGGGIRNDGNMTVTESSVSFNTGSPNAGAIYNGVPATATITDSTLEGNMVTSGTGGAIRNDGSLTIVNSTLSGNSSRSRGGGIYMIGSGTLTVTNSTITGNTDTSIGGGINNEGGTITLANVTLTNNSPDGIYNWSGGSITIKNSIVAAQSGANDCAGADAVTSDGYNIENGTTCGFSSAGDQQSTNPLLVALGNNGGPTLTHALEASSPGIDAGHPSGCTDSVGSPLLLEQRGFLRHVDGDGDFSAICDIGAYEFGSDLAGPCGFFNSLVLMNQSVDTTGTFEACETIKAGPNFQIVAPGDVTFHAGLMVIFSSGFSVESGARMTVWIDPLLSSP